jgi:hypothetical protein
MFLKRTPLISFRNWEISCAGLFRKEIELYWTTRSLVFLAGPNSLIHTFLDADLSTEQRTYYDQVKEMLRDSVYIRVTLNSETPYKPSEDILSVLSSRILYSWAFLFLFRRVLRAYLPPYSRLATLCKSNSCHFPNSKNDAAALWKMQSRLWGSIQENPT